MATFTGTQDEFNKFLGPIVRNKIQQKTKAHKKSLSHICQGCKEPRELQAAHVRGTDRISMIKAVLNEYTNEKTETVSCDIGKVIEKIIKAHTPITDAFKFLCESCHKEYDDGKLQL